MIFCIFVYHSMFLHAFLQVLQETLERQGKIMAYIEKKRKKKSKVTHSERINT
jgi:hypothetical protein